MKKQLKINLDAATIIALGSNLRGPYGSCRELLGEALARLPTAGVRIAARSSWWRSAAWPDETQPEYLNAVAIVETALASRDLLTVLLKVEEGFGRQRGVANTPRTLDLDIIAYGRLIANEGDLILPHPRAADRRFVMGPLAEIAPGWVHPVNNRTAADLFATAAVGRDATPIVTTR